MNASLWRQLPLVFLAGILALALLLPGAGSLAAALQQTSDTATPTLTATQATGTVTGTTTTTVTLSPTLGTGTPSLTPTAGTPGAATSPAASPSATPVTPAATATSAVFASTPSSTPTLTLAPTQPPVLVTLEATVTATATLLPLPEVTYQLPRRTPTQVLLARQESGDPPAIAKGGGLSSAIDQLLRRVRPFTPLLLIGGLWLVLVAWFVLSQVWIHRK